MNSVIPCPSCQSPLAVTAELAGQLIACPACGQRIQLAQAAPAAGAKSKKPERSSQLPAAILATWGILGVLVIVAVVLAWRFRAQRQAEEASAAAAAATLANQTPPISRPKNLPPAPPPPAYVPPPAPITANNGNSTPSQSAKPKKQPTKAMPPPPTSGMPTSGMPAPHVAGIGSTFPGAPPVPPSGFPVGPPPSGAGVSTSANPTPAPAPAPASATVPTACKLPSLISGSELPLLTFPSDPGDDLQVALRSVAANLPAAAAIFIEAGAKSQSWAVNYVGDLNAGQGKLPLGSIRRLGSELLFQWDAQRPLEISRQLANCQLELRTGASAYIVQLREPQSQGELQLDMQSDKQTIEFSLTDWPKTDGLRLDIKELAGFPSGTKVRGDLKSIGLGKSAFIEFADLPGAQIGLRFYRPAANSPAPVIRLEPEFKENAATKHDLTFDHLTDMEVAMTKSLANAKQDLPAAENRLAGAQNNLRTLQGNKPSNFTALNAWQQQVVTADKQVKSAASRVNQLRKQIPEFETRLANVPKVRGFLDTLHKRAAIRYTVVVETGDQDVVLVDAQGPKS